MVDIQRFHSATTAIFLINHESSSMNPLMANEKVLYKRLEHLELESPSDLIIKGSERVNTERHYRYKRCVGGFVGLTGCLRLQLVLNMVVSVNSGKMLVKIGLPSVKVNLLAHTHILRILN